MTISQSTSGRHARPSTDPMPQQPAAQYSMPRYSATPQYPAPQPGPRPAPTGYAPLAGTYPTPDLPRPRPQTGGTRTAARPMTMVAPAEAPQAFDGARIDGPTIRRNRIDGPAFPGPANSGAVAGRTAVADRPAAPEQAATWPSRAERSAQAPVPPAAAGIAAAPRKRRRWPFVVAGIVLLLIVIVAATSANSTPAPSVPAVTVPPVTVPTVSQPAVEVPSVPTQAPASVASGPATEVGDGTYEVGVDLAAGKYKTPGPASDSVMKMCYQERAKNDSGELGSIISNDIVQGPGVMTVKAGEVVKLSGGCQWTKQ